LTREQVNRIAQALPQGNAELEQVARAAAMADISLKPVATDWAGLSKLGGPKVVQLTDPADVLCVTRISQQATQVMVRGGIGFVATERIRPRYRGQALVPADMPSPEGGRAAVAGFHHEFGELGTNQQVSHSFAVTNAGDAELSIMLQAKGCGAPSASLDRETLAPGESAHVTMQFTAGYSGNIVKTAKLLTSDLTQPVIFFTVHGFVPHPARVTPQQMHLTGPKGAPLLKTLILSGPPEMQLEQIVSRDGLLSISPGSPTVTPDAKKLWEIEVALSSTRSAGRFADELRVHTSGADRPVMVVPVVAWIQGDLVASQECFFGFVRPEGEHSAERMLQITSQSGARFALRGATASDPRILPGTPRQTRDGWVVPVRLDTSKPGVIEGTVTLETDVTGEELLAANVYAQVLSSTNPVIKVEER